MLVYKVYLLELGMNTEENLEGLKRLASLKSRALAVFFDLFIFIAIFLPFNAYSTKKSEIIYLIIVYSLLTCIQVYFLAKSGQTIGKKLLKIRISQFHNPNETPGFFKIIILRIVINDLVYLIPIIGLIYLVLNYGLALLKPRRCIHDYLAGTVVTKVDYIFYK
jgi:uncharacterized RDD family membrane protein YckC